ncbi:FG-GAP repeat protein [Streptomyces aureoverticillatus]|uniref:FG-GAP repeat protein n=1 Tax=Streptomyces aureoverticillatus TaxID=66871 RepID=UPI0013DA1043|nr:FG-GAP repeat protein [Streptomyces aureoverticillatus]QIB44561.1 VCBS repeat-containing protein [Streptomyces aureoverticillatus]
MAQRERTTSRDTELPHRPGRRLRLTAATAAALALTGGLLTTAVPTATAAPRAELPATDADFNADGYADVATAASLAYVNGKAQAGAVAVTYGKAGGVGRSVSYTQNSPGVDGSAEKGDHFGTDMAYGDFDRDGYDDLAVGVAGEDVGRDKDGGSVQILWGSVSGLKGGSTVKDPRPSKHDWFGGYLEAADFNGDRKTDLAIGTGTTATVDILRGGFKRSGATDGRYTVTPRIHGNGEVGVQNLHSGDANGDGVEDLIVNGYENDTQRGSNANFWVPGSRSGLKVSAAKKLMPGVITDLGDTDKDGYDDVVIGNYWDSGIAGSARGGAVHVVHGSRGGPSAGDREKFTQNTSGVPGSGEKGDSFGNELDLGDINGDGNLDLIVGAPGETVDGVSNSGAVTILYGAANGSGITGRGAKLLTQNTPGVPNDNEKHDFLGTDVHADDLNGDRRADVVIGAYGENSRNGAVYPLLSQEDGSLKGTAGIYPGTAGISGTGTPRLGANFAD